MKFGSSGVLFSREKTGSQRSLSMSFWVSHELAKKMLGDPPVPDGEHSRYEFALADLARFVSVYVIKESLPEGGTVLFGYFSVAISNLIKHKDVVTETINLIKF